jgi:hypothetical protein
MFNNGCKGVRLHGDYLVVEGNDIDPIYRGGNDFAGVQIDGYDSQYCYIHNNRISAAFTGVFFSDNSLNPSDCFVEQNYITKPRTWNERSWEYQFSAVQGIASATASSSPTTISTTATTPITTGTILAFSGATGNWTPLNYTNWKLTDGSLVSLVVISGTATAITSSAHGLTTGQRISIGGGYAYPCTGVDTLGGSVVITVDSSTQFHWTTGSADFSTVSGTQCQGVDFAIIGPVWSPTTISSSSFSVPLNSTGFGALTGTVLVSFPLARAGKNGFEIKSGKRIKVYGNIVENGFPGQQEGGLTVTVRGSDMTSGWPFMQGAAAYCWNCALTISDITLDSNVVTGVCAATSILGANANGPVIPMERVSFTNTLVYDIGHHNGGNTGCTAANFGIWQGGYGDVFVDHLTVFAEAGGVLKEDYTSSFPNSGPVTINNSIFPSYSGLTNSVCGWAGFQQSFSSGCSSSWSWQTWTQNRNIFYGDLSQTGTEAWSYSRSKMNGVTTGSTAYYQQSFWPSSVGGVGFTGTRSISTCTNASPIVVTTTADHGLTSRDQVFITGVTGNTNANGRWYTRVLSSTTFALVGSIGNGTCGGTAYMQPFSGTAATVANAKLLGSSTFIANTAFVAPDVSTYTTPGSGDATDDTDVGVNTVTLAAALAGTFTTSSGAIKGTSAVKGNSVVH